MVRTHLEYISGFYKLKMFTVYVYELIRKKEKNQHMSVSMLETPVYNRGTVCLGGWASINIYIYIQYRQRGSRIFRTPPRSKLQRGLKQVSRVKPRTPAVELSSKPTPPRP